MIIVYLFAIIVSSLLGWYARGAWEEDNTRPSLEREATLLLLGDDAREISKFAKKYSKELKKKTFDKLYGKIQELLADDLINEDENNLKVRISTFEDKQIELKKLQAEGFIETLNTIKKMCK